MKYQIDNAMSLMLVTCSMAEGVEGDSGVCDMEEVKPDNDCIWKTPVDERISVLLNNDLMSDIKFSVNGKRFHAHKFVLSYASEVFYAMFNGPLADDSEEIEVVDCETPEDFLEFLSLIYRKSAKVTWENVHQLSYLRRKYMVMETRPFSNFIKSIVHTENCLDALDNSVELEEDDMVEECFNAIRRDIIVLVMTERFLQLKQPALKAILKQDMLNINELDLFLAVDKWCTYQVELKRSEGETMKKREVLGDALYHIRFPLIKIESFTRYCRPSKILTTKETVSLYDQIVLGPCPQGFEGKSYDEDDGDISENKCSADEFTAGFISTPRVKGNTLVNLMDDEKFYARSTPNKNDTNFDNSFPDHDALTIMVNRKVFLVALKIVGPWKKITLPPPLKLKEVTSEDGLAWLERPLGMKAFTKYSVACESIFRPEGYRGGRTYAERMPTKYKWNDFQCTIYQPWGSYVAPISQLVFKTFGGAVINHFDFPLLTMRATKSTRD